ncbi:hypothetical protein [Falsiroseomonas sp.]|uniref:hypothetical protein n=1 Tax=Falsiroseomonas sp. TaxID=2870721 RepID=UPI003F6E4615
MLVTLAGTLIAILPVLVAYALWRLMRVAWRLLRQPRMRLGVLAAQVGRLRLRLRWRRAPLAVGDGPGTAVLAEQVARLKAELRVARAELALLEAARPGTGLRLPWQRPADDRFTQAKLAFARAFHPDRLPDGLADTAIRAAIFKEFWDVLRRIERG